MAGHAAQAVPLAAPIAPASPPNPNFTQPQFPVPAPVPAPDLQQTREAEIALQLAHSYLQEFQDAIFDHIADSAYMRSVQETLALMSRQIALAQSLDPSARVTLDNTEGSVLTIDAEFLKARALFYEGISYAPTNMKRAVNILRKAEAVAPTFAPVHYWIGQIEAAQLNKREAIAAFEKAVALDPDDIDVRKALDRARSISGASIAVDRTFAAGHKTVNAARWLGLALALLPLLLLGGGLVTGNYPAAIAGFIILMITGAILKGVDFAKGWLRRNLS